MRWVFAFLVACLVISNPPDPSRLIEEYVVNLDLAPEDRWTDLVTKKEDAIRNMLAFVQPILMSQNISAPMIASVIKTIPTEYLREMQGIAKATQLTLDEIVMANIFYEITSVTKGPLDLSRSCTSLVAQRANGTVYIARNQDYPPPFTLIMIHAIFQRANKTVYQGTTYAGTIGLSTAAVFSPNSGWAVSIDARDYPGQGSPAAEQAALTAAADGAAIFPIITRQACESCSNFTSAVNYLSTRDMISTGYFIVAGGANGEGAIVTRNASGNSTDVLRLFDPKVRDEGGGDWYVAQSNTDHWKPEPIYPLTNVTRRGTATKALDKIGAADIDLLGLWNVLDIYPVFNLATIHTDLVAVSWGEYKTYKRFGPL